MNKQYRFRIDGINIILRFMIFLTFTSFILFTITEDDLYIWKSLMLFPAALISFLIRKYSKNIWSFIMLQLLLLVVYIFLADEMILRVAYGINIIVFAITEFVLDINKKIKNTPLVFSIIIIALYTLCKAVYPEENMLILFFFSTAISFGLLYVLNTYYVNSFNYFKKHEEKANIPIRNIQSTNTFYIGGFLILFFLVMILFTRIPLDGLGLFFRAILIRFIKFLISISAIIPKKPEEIILEEEVLDNNEPFIIPEPTLLSEIATVIFGGLAIIIIVAALIYGLIRIYRIFYSKVVIVDDVQREKITPFIKDNSKTVKNSSTRPRIRSLFDNSNNVKIRRLYIRAVRKNTQPDELIKYKLPQELSEYAMGPGNPDMDKLENIKKKAELTAIYEKARYSNKECSKEEVKLIKNMLK